MAMLTNMNPMTMMMKSTTRDNNKEDNMNNGPFFFFFFAMRAAYYENMGRDDKTVEPYYRGVKPQPMSHGDKPATQGVESEDNEDK